MLAFVNHQFLEEGKATLQVGDLAIQRGYGVFDFFRTCNNIPLFPDDHLDRFFNSAAFMRLQPDQTRKELTAIIYGLIKKNNLGESGIKVILTGGYSPEGCEPLTPNLIIIQQRLQVPPPERFTEGVKVITYKYQRELPEVKSINYLMGVWLQQKVNEQHAADVLYYSNGIVSELPRANVFMVTPDKKIVTPSLNILKGITRMKLLELASKEYEVEVRAIGIEEIKHASEIFMTSTTKRLLPITRLDDAVIGNGKAGPITTLLSGAFIKMEERVLQENKNWPG